MINRVWLDVECFLGPETLRRSRLDIVKGILESARRGATKTQIVYRSNLNFRIVDECLVRMLKGEYLTVKEDRDGRVQFYTTEKGIVFLVELTKLSKAIHEILNGPEESSEREQPPTLIPRL